MRAWALLRAARAAVAATEPLGCATGACGALGVPHRVLVQLAGPLGQQLQQQAGYAAARHPDDDDEEAAAAPGGRHSKLSHSERRLLWERKLREEQELAGEEEAVQARRRIAGLLRDMGHGDDDSASQFVSSFFGERGDAAAAAAGRGSDSGSDSDEEGLRYTGEGSRYAAPRRPLAAGGAAEAPEQPEEELDEEVVADTIEVALPAALEEDEEVDLLGKLQGLRPGSRRIVLQKLLEGGIMRADPQARAEWEAIQQQFEPLADFRMKVVDVNRTCKGTRTGGLYRYTCMVVVGNGNGVLGWGQGKAAEVGAAVQKAYARACRNLYPIPRYNGHTIPEPMNAKYGQVRVTMYPKASGNGIVANALMYDICKMAGIFDIGIKVHGSRNVRNAVKCVFKAFDQMRTEEQREAAAAAAGTLLLKMPPGRYRHLRVQAPA